MSPPAPQVLLALRPAELLAQDEGVKLLAALGPEAAAARDHVQSTLGVDLADVEQLLIAFVPAESGAPQAAYAARLTKPVPQSQLLAAWNQPRATELAGQPCFVRDAVAYCLPAADEGRVILVAPPAVLEETLARSGQPLLRKGIESLLAASDASRHVNLLAAPGYLLSDGRDLLAGSLEKLREPLERIFGMQTQAILLSGHLADELFLEMRVAGPADVRPDKLAHDLRDELNRAGDQVELYVASLTPQPYGRLIVNRFPRMLQLVGNFTRSAAEDRQAVLRCYLPASAAHNLALGAELTLHESPGGTISPVPSAMVGLPIGAEGALGRTVSLSFPRDTLEHSLELLSAEIGTPDRHRRPGPAIGRHHQEPVLRPRRARQTGPADPVGHPATGEFRRQAGLCRSSRRQRRRNHPRHHSGGRRPAERAAPGRLCRGYFREKALARLRIAAADALYWN